MQDQDSATTSEQDQHAERLVPVIAAALEAADREQREQMAHYEAAGAMLWEAKSQMPPGEFTSWVEEEIGISIACARVYMAFAAKASRTPTAAWCQASVGMENCVPL